MLFITGLLTLLAIAHAGGDHIKGGFRVKGGSVSQQKVAQEDIITPPFSTKSATPFGTKVIKQEADVPSIKTVQVPTLQHAVKTAVNTPGKIQTTPGLHHTAATSPVVQDQVAVDDPTSGSTIGVKTVKSGLTGKTRFTQSDTQVRDPIARPVGQRVDSADESLKIKTLKSIATKTTKLSSQDIQIRDPVFDPVIQAVKTARDPGAGTKQIKTVKTLQDPETGTTQIRAVKTTSTGKTRFSQGDEQARDPTTHPIIHTVKTLKDPSESVVQKTTKTITKTADLSRGNTKVKTSQQAIDSRRISNIPVSIVEAARRNTLRVPPAVDGVPVNSYDITRISGEQRAQLNALLGTQIQEIPGIVNEFGEIILDQKTLQTLQNSGGIINENGQISLNEKGIKILQSIRSDSSLEYSSEPLVPGINFEQNTAPVRPNTRTNVQRKPETTASRTILRTGVLGQRQNANNQNQIATRIRTASSPSVNTRSSAFQSSRITSSQFISNARSQLPATSVYSDQRRSPLPGGAGSGGSFASGTVLFNGKEISIDGVKEGQIFDENLRPVVLEKTGSIAEKPGTLPGSTPQNFATPFRNAFPKPRVRSSQSSQADVLRSRVTTTLLSGTDSSSRSAGTSLPQSISNVRTGSLDTSIPQRTSQAVSDNIILSPSVLGTALFNGKEVSLDSIKEGQIYDENLKPILAENVITTSEKSGALSRSTQTSGLPSRNVAPRPRTSSSQVSQRDGLRSSILSTSSRTTDSSRSRISFSQSTPNERTESLRISTVQTGNKPAGGIISGETLTSGSVLFSGKEINIDGLRTGQLFDENLRPIVSGTSGINAEKSSSLPGVPKISGIPSTNAAPKPSLRSSQRSQVAGLRSSVTTSLSRGANSNPRTPKVPLSRSSQNAIPASLTSGISSAQRSSESARRTASGNIITSGKVLFEGKEITIDAFKEGQLYDESLKPILSKNTGIVAEKSQTLFGSPQISNSPPGSAGSRPRVRIPLTSQAGTSRSSTATSSARGAATAARLPGLPITQSNAPGAGYGFSVGSISKQKTRSQTAQRIAPVASFTTGTALFNGKEISIDGLKEGQLFDENLKPIAARTSVTSSEKPTQLSNIVSSSAAQRPASGSSQRSQIGRLRSSTIAGSVRGPISGSRLASTSVSQSSPSLRTGSLGASVSSVQTSSASIRGVAQGGALTSGTVLFNGKEINVDGLKDGQLFDENFKPILSGSSDVVAEKSSFLPASPQIIDVPSRSIAPKPKVRSSQSSKITGLRSSVINAPVKPRVRSSQRSQSTSLRSSVSSSSSGVVGSSRTSFSPLLQSTPNVRVGSLPASISSAERRYHASRGVTTGGSLTSGKVQFNGKEISIDGLKEGQLFDENLRPILSQSPKIAGAPISNAPTRNAALKPVENLPQRIQGGGLPFSVITEGGDQSSPNIRAGSLGTRISSIQRSSAAVGGVSPGGTHHLQGGTASGKVLFDGKEISVDGFREGQLFDENLKPIISRSNVLAEKPISLPASPQIGGIPTRSAAPKPSVRSSQRSVVTNSRSSVATSSSRGVVGSSRTIVSPLLQSTPNVRSGSLPASVSSAQRGTPASRGTFSSSRLSSSSVYQPSANLRAGSLGTSISHTQTDAAAVRRVAEGGTLTSGTALFNGKEISVDGLREGQLFDENLRPILSDRSDAVAEKSSSLPSSSQISGLSSRNIIPQPATGFPQSPQAARLRSSVSSSSSGGVQRSSAADSRRSAASSASSPTLSNLRGQTTPLRNSQPALGTLGYIDVTRSDESLSPSGISSENLFNGRRTGSSETNGMTRVSLGTVSRYANRIGSRGSGLGDKLSQDRIIPEISQHGIETPVAQIQERDHLIKALSQNIPTDTRQTQLKIENILEQSSLSKPDILKTVQVQETVPYSVSDTPKIISKKTTQVSQKDIDIPITEQKLFGGDFSGYLPKTSFLPPFNYALPQLSTSKYAVQSPIVQEQQKVEQIFV